MCPLQPRTLVCRAALGRFAAVLVFGLRLACSSRTHGAVWHLPIGVDASETSHMPGCDSTQGTAEQADEQPYLPQASMYGRKGASVST